MTTSPFRTRLRALFGRGGNGGLGSTISAAHAVEIVRGDLEKATWQHAGGAVRR